MPEYIGVITWYDGDISDDLKRAAMLFDRIAFAHSHSQLECDVFSATPSGRKTLQTVDELRRAEVIIDCPSRTVDLAQQLGSSSTLTTEWEYESQFLVVEKLDSAAGLYTIMTAMKLKDKGYDEYRTTYFYSRAARFADLHARLAAAYLRRAQRQEATAFVADPAPTADLTKVKRSSALRTIMHHMPTPSPQTSIRDILAFRDNPTGFSHHRKLTMWMHRQIDAGILVRDFAA